MVNVNLTRYDLHAFVNILLWATFSNIDIYDNSLILSVKIFQMLDWASAISITPTKC